MLILLSILCTSIQNQLFGLGDRPEMLKLKTHLAETLTELDLQIIQSLQEDSRLSLNKIADKLGTSVSTAQKHIKKLEERGVVKGYTAIVDPVKLGYGVTAIVFVQVEGGRLLDVEHEIAKEDNVLAVYDITGDYDAALVTKFKDNSSLNAFIKRLLSMRYIKRTVTNVALDVVKEDFKII